MAGPLYYPPTQNGLQKTLDADLNSGVTASLTLNNATSIQNLPGVLVVDRVDAGGTEKTAAEREFIIYTGVSGSTLTGLTRGQAGSSDQDHSTGAIVEFIPDILWAQSIADALANIVNTTTLAIDTDKVLTPNPATLASLSVVNDLRIGATDNIIPGGSDPWRTITIGGGSLKTTTTGGAGSGQKETTTNKINYDTIDFDDTAEESCYVSFTMPVSYDGGRVQVKASFSHVSGASGTGVALGVKGRSFADNEALDQACGAEVYITKSIAHIIGDQAFTDWSSLMTLAGTPAGGEKVYFEVARKVGDASDDMVGDLTLADLVIRYRQAQYTD